MNADEAGVYIEHAAQWFASHNVAYQSYWNLNSDFDGWLSGGRHPGTGAAYIAAFRPQGVEHWTDGTAADEAFAGTDQDDYIDASAGNDMITGGLGSDILNGGLGNDALNGGTGDDVLISGAGNDTVSGGDGDDHIEGGPGDDVLAGDNGSDVMRGGPGNDIINGGADDDLFAGDAGNDTINGGSGVNTANYGGLRLQYQITQNGDGSIHIVDLRANSPDGADDVRNVRYLHFADGTVALNYAPVVSASDYSLSRGQVVGASSLFSVSDTDGDAITQYQFWDSTAASTSGHFVVDGVAQGVGQAIDVSAAQLGRRRSRAVRVRMICGYEPSMGRNGAPGGSSTSMGRSTGRRW